MHTQQRRANACSLQALVRKREPRTQLRCFEMKPGIFNLEGSFFEVRSLQQALLVTISIYFVNIAIFTFSTPDSSFSAG